MKALLAIVLAGALAAAVALVPFQGRTIWARALERGAPQAAARMTAHGLRSGWDWLWSLGQKDAGPHAPPRHLSRKAQAAAAHRTSREGIVAQPPKEKLQPSDRAALDALVQRGR